MKPISNLLVFTDGGARGNPGPSAIGVYITDEEQKRIAGFGKKIGATTNNVAEYKAVLAALSWIKGHKKDFEKNAKISFFLDSKLVCLQIQGVFKIKDPQLRNLFLAVREKEGEIGMPFSYTYIPREQNAKADFFVNQALDRAELD